MSGIVEEYKWYKIEDQDIKRELQQFKENSSIIEKENLVLKNTLIKLEGYINELKEKHHEEIKDTKDRLKFDCEKRVLQLEKQYQNQIQKLNQEHNEKIKELLVELKNRERPYKK